MTDLLKLGTASARPGQKSWGQLRVREGKKKVSLPVCAIHGARPGPHAVVIAAQHGQEVNGIESVRRFCLGIDPKKLRGTVFAIPCMNPFAVMRRQQVWDEDDAPQTLKAGEDHYKNRYNMNWSWKQERGKSLVRAITYEVWHRAICSPGRKAVAVIDIHCHEGESAIYVSDPNDPKELAIALASGLRILYFKGGDGDVATLYESCKRAGITDTTVELHRQHMFCRKSIDEGVRLIRNMLGQVGIVPGKLQLPPKCLIPDPWNLTKHGGEGQGKSYLMLNSRYDGIVVSYQEPCVRVRKGDLICEVIDPHKAKVLQTERAPINGFLQQVPVYSPSVKKGERLVLFAFRYRLVNPARELRELKAKIGEGN